MDVNAMMVTFVPGAHVSAGRLSSRRGRSIVCQALRSERIEAASERLNRLKRGDFEKSQIVKTPDGLVEVSEELKAKQAAFKSAEERKTYDPAESQEYFRDKRIQLWRRRIEVAGPLLAFVSSVVLDWQQGKELERRPIRAKEFEQLIARFGPAYIKAGQALSSRPDLLPPEYLVELQKLQDRLPPFDNDQAFELIESELGAKLSDIFETLDPEPVAAASIGQVYKAYLKTGEAVAVKVQRPNCEEIIQMDIYILRRLSGAVNEVLRVINKDFDLALIVDEFGKLIYDEIDYLNEARNAERFKELYGNLDNVIVPRVYWKYTSSKILTTEWIDGVRLESNSLGDERSRLVRTLTQCSLRQMLENGYFHADPHGGNLLATPDGNLCYLDFGMMSSLTREQSYGIILAIVNLVNRDWEELVELYKRLGMLAPESESEPIVAALNDAMPNVLTASVAEFNFKSVINKLGYIFYAFEFTLPPYYTAILRCLGVLEGVCIQVDPNYKILNEAYPFVASRLLTDRSDELQDALEKLLTTKEGELVPGRWSGLVDAASRMSGEDIGHAMQAFSEFLLTDRATEIRNRMADVLVEDLDKLGLDLGRYVNGNLAFRSIWPFRAQPGDEEMSSRLEGAIRAVQDSFMQRGVRLDGLSEAMSGFLAKPEGQRLAAEVLFGLAERVTSRSIRATFGLPQTIQPRTTRQELEGQNADPVVQKGI